MDVVVKHALRHAVVLRSEHSPPHPLSTTVRRLRGAQHEVAATQAIVHRPPRPAPLLLLLLPLSVAAAAAAAAALRSRRAAPGPRCPRTSPRSLPWMYRDDGRARRDDEEVKIRCECDQTHELTFQPPVCESTAGDRATALCLPPYVAVCSGLILPRAPRRRVAAPPSAPPPLLCCAPPSASPSSWRR